MCGWQRLGGLGVSLLLAFAGMPTLAASQAVVERVQMPAWLERAGRSQPLEVNMEVKNGDRILTGRGARATLKLAEGSTVKLGENAALGFYSRSLKPQRVFKGALDVVKGAFRLTTAAAAGSAASRDLSIRVGTATAGIVSLGGTDLWGKSDSDRDLILLIEGKISLRHGGEAVAIEPMTLFVSPRNAAPLPVAPVASVDPEQFRRWVRETEALPGEGMTRRGGQWKVLLARAGSEAEALAVYDKARAAGYAAKIRPRSADGGWVYDVLLAQLASEQEAVVLAYKVNSQLGYPAEPIPH